MPSQGPWPSALSSSSPVQGVPARSILQPRTTSEVRVLLGFLTSSSSLFCWRKAAAASRLEGSLPVHLSFSSTWSPSISVVLAVRKSWPRVYSIPPIFLPLNSISSLRGAGREILRPRNLWLVLANPGGHSLEVVT